MPEKEQPKPQEQKPKPKLPIKTIVVILGVLLLEGGTISLFMVMRGGPQMAGASDPIEGATDQSPPMSAVAIVEGFAVDNYVSGRTRTVINLDVSAKVEQSRTEAFEARILTCQAEIRDRLRTLISSASPDHLRDPRTQVIKRDIKTALEEIIGEGYIEEILIPSWQSYTAD